MINSYRDLIDLKNKLDPNDGKVIDMKNPNCSNCNQCCSIGTPLSESDYKRIKKYITKDKQGKIAMREAKARLDKYTKKGIVYLLCPFSNNNRRCSIYKVRPEICKEFHCDSEIHANFNKEEFHKNKYKLIIDLFKGRD